MVEYRRDEKKIARYKSNLFSISGLLDPLRSRAEKCHDLWPEGRGIECALILYGADDAIDDSELALCAFVDMDWPGSTDQRQLLAYGFFQALFIQQEAVIAVSHAADMKTDLKHQTATWKLRSLRNKLVGHPAPDKKTGWTSSSIFGRGSITPSTIQYSVYEGPDLGFSIDPTELASEQFRELASLTESAVKKIWKNWDHILSQRN